jgi:hypothetical protein
MMPSDRRVLTIGAGLTLAALLAAGSATRPGLCHCGLDGEQFGKVEPRADRQNSAVTRHHRKRPPGVR